MEVFRKVAEIKEFVRQKKAQGKVIGLVPTMGYFHQGHLALMREAKNSGDTVVVSIYVNPLQFGPQEDLTSYPRDEQRDLALAGEIGVDAVFIPADAEMYPNGFSTYVEVEQLTSGLCGQFRPGHFKGVTTVVLKLFNIVTPDRAYFGQKDYQQLVVVRKMAEDLNLDVEIVGLPTVRELDGLALSSRNVYLNPEERKAAPLLQQSLLKAKEEIVNGERSPEKIRDLIARILQSEPLIRTEYIEVREARHLEPLEYLEGRIVIALAARVGKARLIDNILLEV